MDSKEIQEEMENLDHQVTAHQDSQDTMVDLATLVLKVPKVLKVDRVREAQLENLVTD
jgi:hypothetical protein